MSPFVLSVLKYSLLVLLYLFIWRAVRTIALDLRTAPEQGSQATSKARSRKEGKPPTSVVVRAGDGKRVGTHRLTSPLQVGRSETCEVRLEDAYVSQVHARLFPRDGAWHVEDLGSTNGTFLNEERVMAPVRVQPGDRVRVGTTVMELRR